MKINVNKNLFVPTAYKLKLADGRKIVGEQWVGGVRIFNLDDGEIIVAPGHEIILDEEIEHKVEKFNGFSAKNEIESIKKRLDTLENLIKGKNAQP